MTSSWINQSVSRTLHILQARLAARPPHTQYCCVHVHTVGVVYTSIRRSKDFFLSENISKTCISTVKLTASTTSIKSKRWKMCLYTIYQTFEMLACWQDPSAVQWPIVVVVPQWIVISNSSVSAEPPYCHSADSNNSAVLTGRFQSPIGRIHLKSNLSPSGGRRPTNL